MQETSQNIDGLKKRIKELEFVNGDLTMKNEAYQKKQSEMTQKLVEAQSLNSEIGKKQIDEIPRLREKLEKAET